MPRFSPHSARTVLLIGIDIWRGKMTSSCQGTGVMSVLYIHMMITPSKAKNTGYVKDWCNVRQVLRVIRFNELIRGGLKQEANSLTQGPQPNI
jgi:hypothetical protein